LKLGQTQSHRASPLAFQAHQAKHHFPQISAYPLLAHFAQASVFSKRAKCKVLIADLVG
jgi:hypothetical protein